MIKYKRHLIEQFVRLKHDVIHDLQNEVLKRSSEYNVFNYSR